MDANQRAYNQGAAARDCGWKRTAPSRGDLAEWFWLAGYDGLKVDGIHPRYIPDITAFDMLKVERTATHRKITL